MKSSTNSWLRLAEKDLLAAKKLLEDEMLGNLVFFHCQQAIEKILKGILEEHLIPFPKTHSVIKLYVLLPKKQKIKTLIKKH